MKRHWRSHSSAPERLAAARLAQEQISALLDTLSDAEMVVVKTVFGLWDGVPQPLVVTARALGRPPAEVSRILHRAIVKLGASDRSEALRGFLGNGLPDVSREDPRAPLSEYDFGAHLSHPLPEPRPDVVPGISRERTAR